MYTPPNGFNDNLPAGILVASKCTLMVQCTAEDGTVGDWLRHDATNTRISPMLEIVDLYAWIRDNGFKPVREHGFAFPKYVKHA